MPVVKNILKDGTVVADMSKVTVPKEITDRIAAALIKFETSKGKEKKS